MGFQNNSLVDNYWSGHFLLSSSVVYSRVNHRLDKRFFALADPADESKVVVSSPPHRLFDNAVFQTMMLIQAYVLLQFVIVRDGQDNVPPIDRDESEIDHIQSVSHITGPLHIGQTNTHHSPPLKTQNV